MPYARRNFRRSRKPNRRSRKGKARGRFARKSFSRRVPRGLKAGLYIPREAYVKLPYTEFKYNPTLTSGANWTFGFNGNGICSPATTGSTSPSSGQEYPLGLDQYSNFYKYYKVLGASIKITLNNLNAANTTADAGAGAFTCCLLAGQGLNGDTDALSNWNTYFSSETRNLINYPGASWRIMNQNGSNTTNIWLKGFRKTKAMLGRKDIRDNDDCQGLLPGTDADFPNGTNPSPAQSGNGSNSGSWFYMVRVDPSGPSTTILANSVLAVVKIKYYVQLYGRDFNTQGIVPE